MLFQQQWHGYRRGHQLLQSTIELSSGDQDLIDKLSDASGSPRPGERFEPYLTIYPLPSGDFHVVARTWQDLEAPRSGTVFTRSVLIPSEIWMNLRELGQLADLLDDREITGKPLEILPGWRSLPPVYDPRLAELTEALFLERAGPVACFGFDNPELISLRLVQALWPARKAAFSLCTYALGPRNLMDRDFDLVFAPESARSRFGRWKGRKISVGSPPANSRHAWTQEILKRIFTQEEPELGDLDELGVLDSSSGKSEGSALRLALLWGDLKRASPTSPKSVLGMLDILNSLGRRPWELPYFAQLVSHALSRSMNSPDEETWQLLRVIVRKLGDEIPLDVLRSLFSTSRSLGSSAPELISGGGQDDPLHTVPHLLRPGLARGLSDLSKPELTAFLVATPPDITVSLMAESPPFAQAVSRCLSEAADAKAIHTIAGLVKEDPRAGRRMALNVARGATSSRIKPLLRVSLESIPRSNFGLVASAVLAAGGTKRADLIAELIEFGTAMSELSTLRQLGLQAPNADEGDQVLLEAVHGRDDVTWLIEQLSAMPDRLHRILLQVMRRGSDAFLREVANHSRNKDAFFGAALRELPNSAKDLQRLVKLVPAPASTTISILRRAGERLSDRETVATASLVLEQLFSVETSSIPDLMKPILAIADPARIIAAATSSGLKAKQVGTNIATISSSVSAARFTPRIDIITVKMIERRSGGFGKEGYDGWASLLRKARADAPEALVRSADAALDYCLRLHHEPAGSVVAAAFPIVHARLAKKNNLPDIPLNVLAAVVYASISLFTDWDRAKEARQGIVEAFLKSKWQPADLLLAGIDAKVTDKILGYLVSRNGGREYLRKIERGIASYPAPTQKLMKSALASFRS